MKVGLKIFYGYEMDKLRPFLDSIDFVEVMAIEGNDYSFLKEINLPFVIHNQHHAFGVNPANPSKLLSNKSSLDFSIKLADKMDAKTIILHPGFYEDNNCSEDTFFDLLKDYNDKRIILENLNFNSHGFENQGYDYKSMKLLMDKTKKGMCLDFEHACLSAFRLNKDMIGFVKEIMALKPRHFHMSNMTFNPMKNHLHFSDGELPLAKLKKMLSNNDLISIETDKDEKSWKDIEFLRN